MTLLSEIIPNLLGPQGPQGAQGAGFQGDQGAPGPQGDNGDNGETGPQGTQGVAGSNGSQGPQGDIGFQGPQGNQGYQGLRGFQGFTGDVGPQGVAGPQGFQGDTGPQGPQGDQGDQGNQGFQGDVGSGSQGAVPYEIWGEYGSNSETLTYRTFSLQFDSASPWSGDYVHFYYKLELYSRPLTETPYYFGKYEVHGYLMGILDSEDPLIIDSPWRVSEIDYHRTSVGEVLEGVWYQDPTISGGKLRLNWIHGATEFYTHGFRLLVYPILQEEISEGEVYDYFSDYTIVESIAESQSGIVQSQQIHSGLIVTRSLEDFEALSSGYQTYAARALDVRGDARVQDELYLDTLHTDSSGYQGLLGKHSSKAVAQVDVGAGLNLTAAGTLNAKTYTATIGNGSDTVITVTHGFTLSNAAQLIIQLYEVSSGEQVFTTTEAISTTQVRFTFGVAPTTNQYRAVIFMI
jgi:hypothetical protein